MSFSDVNRKLHTFRHRLFPDELTQNCGDGDRERPYIQFSRFPVGDNETDDEYEEIERWEDYKIKVKNSSRSCFQNLGIKFPSELWEAGVKGLLNEVNYLFLPPTDLTMIYTQENIRTTAFISRLILLCIQIFANLTLPEHLNDGYKMPGPDLRASGTFLDKIIQNMFCGFGNWDGQYFLHIATKGYTHENTMAFFPLFPMIIGAMARFLEPIFFYIVSKQSLALVIGWLFNSWCFQNAAVALSEIVKYEGGRLDGTIITTALYLFCYNPASVFFSAFYTESLFAWMTFSCILAITQRKFGRAVYFASFGAICRSNGLLNFGLIAVGVVGSLVTTNWKAEPENCTWKFFVISRKFFKTGILGLKIGLYFLLGLVPFVAFQLYCVIIFCQVGGHEDTQSESLPEVCRYDGLPYTYIQKKNWNVGFLQYFEVKQIPNFILAMPVLITLASEAYKHAKDSRFMIFQMKQLSYKNFLELGFAWHGMFLCFFCLFFVHVQVSTRMIMSACPYIYYYIAKNLNNETSLFLSRRIKWTPYTFFINIWFSLFFLVGTIGFSLGYPWT